MALLALAAVWAWALWSAFASTGSWQFPFRIAAIATLVVVLVATTFSSMTIVVKEGEVVWWFGIGWPRSHMLLDGLVDASTTRGTIWQGWGIHLTGRGWLWNLRGLNAVRLRTATHRGVVLGTDRPQELLDAIARARWAGAA